MRDYELVYILDPDLSEEAINGLMTRVQTLAEQQNSEIQSQERWERRRLAYEIDRKREGIYVVMEFKATPSAIQEIERILRITDGVLRHMVVRAEEVKSPFDRERDLGAPEAAPSPSVAETAEAATPEVEEASDAEETQNEEADAEETQNAEV
jgi:small subunit ribosomal protein S6